MSARAASPCPACGASGRARVWEASGVPLRPCTAPGGTRADALAIPRGDIRLVLCSACGLLNDEAHDPARLAAAGDGPSCAPAASAGHDRRLRALASRLVRRWGVRRGRVVDVGCGAGEFLRAMCDLGGNRGVGIDPAAPLAPPCARVDLLRDRYAYHHTCAPADLVCARSLLERHPQPRALLELIRAQVRRPPASGRPTALALLQVPDGRPTLERAVPWEVDPERCSYFSPGSLARLARLAGLEVLEVAAAERQLTLTARACAPGAAVRPHALEDDLPALRTAASGFAARARLRIAWWRSELRGALGTSRIALWGADARGAAFLAAVGDAGAAIDCVVDRDPGRWRARMAGGGQPVVSPRALRERTPDAVVVLDEDRVDEVRQDLERLELGPQVVAA